MKNLLLSLTTLLLIQFSSAQNLTYTNCAVDSTANSPSSLHFPDSVWQLGSSNKTIAQSLARPILITDTLNSYPPNTTTSFVSITQVIIGSLSAYATDSIALTVDIAFDTDSLVDYATFYYSCDSGMTWQLLEIGNANVYSSKYSVDVGPWVYNDNPPLSGKFKGTFVWKLGGCYPSLMPTPPFGRYFSVRVDFTSDSIDTAKEGVAITKLCVDVFGFYANSIEEYSVKKIKAFPNPTNGTVHLETEELTRGTLSIYSAQGIVLTKQAIEPTSNEQIEIDLSGYPDGVYYLQFIGEGVSAFSSIVKID